VARILIVAGGCRGRQLAAELVRDGHAVRVTTRSELGREAIEASGAECWIGTPDRLATMRGALDRVAILCWLLGTATGAPEELAALHSTRLEFFLTQAIDTTVRGLVYEASGAPAGLLNDGAQRARALAARNSIPLSSLHTDPRDPAAWREDARAAIDALLAHG
jgi:uncharacterized protein YbjT (DUF2867 family)